MLEFPQKWDQQVTFSEVVVLQISELQHHNRRTFHSECSLAPSQRVSPLS